MRITSTPPMTAGRIVTKRFRPLALGSLLIGVFGTLVLAATFRFDVIGGHRGAGQSKQNVPNLTSANKNSSGEESNNERKRVPGAGPQFYVSPSGTPSGEGTIARPWDLATALAQPPAVTPGSTIWLRSGTYTGPFVSTLAGTPSAPIRVRQYPQERATLDKSSSTSANGSNPALKVRGPWVEFWDFEVTNSYPDRARTSPYTGRVEPWRGNGADVYAPGVKFINMAFHDNGHGIWDKQDGTEIYGCLFYYNGNNTQEHALYLGNTAGTKRVEDNIIFDQGGYGVHAYANSTSGHLSGLEIEGNAVFNNGAITLDDQTSVNILVGGVAGVPAERIALRQNYVYSPAAAAASKSQGVRLGHGDRTNKDVVVADNYVVGRQPLRLWWWQSVELHGNTVYTQGVTAELLMAAGVSTSSFHWDNNSYISGLPAGPVFNYEADSSLGLAVWRQLTRLDAHSQVTGGGSLRPGGVQVYVRPNKYEAGRGHIIVYDWDGSISVAVDVSGIGLKVGEAYEVRDAQNYYGPAVASGTYDGRPIQVPMNLSAVAQPVGQVERAPTHTAPEFAAFVIRRNARSR